jgi:nitrite reductase/ring-hydroxylating ferredoxin subunit
MLAKHDNELICRIGPGTPMGKVMRHYWLPVLLPKELEADGPPLRCRLLGEDLIAFRDTSGRIGFIQNACPHRGASLFFGRNEELDPGLRCVYHGWKFDVDGNCIDMPNEPPESDFRSKVKATAYPGREWGGVIWCFMGDRDQMPGLPHHEWCLVPPDQRRVQWKAVRECNWLQALEGDLDSSHTGFLHGTLNRASVMEQAGLIADNAPVLNAMATEMGAMYGARRSLRPDSYYWRITQFVMPFYGLFPGAPDGSNPMHIWVPIDDDNTLSWGLDWKPSQPFSDEELDESKPSFSFGTGGGAEYAPTTSRPHGAWYTVANAQNNYLMDRQVQRTQTFSGVPTIALQDTAVTESMGAIFQRDTEHLGTSDVMIIRTRARLLGIANAMRERNELPPAAFEPEHFRLRSCAIHLPRDVDWVEATKDWLAAKTTEMPAQRVEVPLGRRTAG